jgi:hypothetical protein
MLGYPAKRAIFQIDKVRLHPRMVKAEGNDAGNEWLFLRLADLVTLKESNQTTVTAYLVCRR